VLSAYLIQETALPVLAARKVLRIALCALLRMTEI
jgi:hypothetical protein